MTVFVPTELRKCGACKKDYVTALAAEVEDGVLAPWEEPCPYCHALPSAVEPRETRALSAR